MSGTEPDGGASAISSASMASSSSVGREGRANSPFKGTAMRPNALAQIADHSSAEAPALTFSEEERPGEAWMLRTLAALRAQLAADCEKHAQMQDQLVVGLMESLEAESGSANHISPTINQSGSCLQAPKKETSSFGLAGLRTLQSKTFNTSDRQHDLHSFTIGNLDTRLKRVSIADKLRMSFETHESGTTNAAASTIGNLVYSVLNSFDAIKEPERTGCMAKFERSKLFAIPCMMVIFFNAITIAYFTDLEIQHVHDPPLERKQYLGRMLYVELFCTMFYAMELTIKLVVHRLYFFVNGEAKWNWFDFILVLFSVLEYIGYAFGSHYQSSSRGVNLSFMRMLRIFKVAKVLRVFRTVRFFTELRLMMDCVIGSFINLFWCLIMLIFVLYVFALLIVQGLTQTLRVNSDHLDPLFIEYMIDYFGSVKAAIVTLLQSTTSGLDWRDVYQVLEHSEAHLLPWLFLFYILFFAIAVWNVVTSTFIEKALKLAQPDLETLTLEQTMKDCKDAEELSEIFSNAGTEGTQAISLEEFRNLLARHRKFRSYLQIRGIDIKNAELFYNMLCTVSQDDKVDVQTLVHACLRMKGLATSIDLHSLSFETKLLSRKQAQFWRECMVRLSKIEEMNARVLQAHPELIGHSPINEE